MQRGDTGPDAAGQADHAHLRVSRQCLTQLRPVAGHQVKHARWQANLIRDFGKQQRIARRQLTGFDHDGIAGHQRRGGLTRNQEEREVPRQDANYHADGFFEQEDVFIRPVALDNLPLIAARPLGHIVEVVGSKQHFYLGQFRCFTAFGDDQLRQLRLSVAYAFGQSM
ncbi:hypothetical protein D3C80_1135030 [compost metagenome]